LNRTIPILFLLLVFLQQVSFSQKEELPGCVPVVYKVIYSRSDSSLFNNSNEILKEFSRDAVKNLGKTKIIMDFCVFRKDSLAGDGSSLSTWWFSDPLISGDVRYRGFDMRPFLIPDRVNIVFGRFSPADSSFSGETGMVVDHWPGRDHPANLKMNKAEGEREDTLELHHLRLTYDENAFNAFTERQRLVDDYFASSAILDTLSMLTGRLSLDDLNNYPEIFILLEESHKILSLIEKRDLAASLSLSTYDPLHFISKFDAVYKSGLSLDMTFRERMESAHLRIDPDREDSLIHCFLSGIRRYIRWSMLVNDQNSGIYKEYLGNYFRMAEFGDDSVLIRSLVRNVFPESSVDSVLRAVSERILRMYEMEAGQLSAENNFAESVELLENQRQFASKNPYLPTEIQSGHSLEQAAGGIYNSYLAVADYALGLKRYTMAENYIRKAVDYRNSKQQLKFPDSLYQHILRELFFGRVSDCDTLKAEGQYEEALDCYIGIRKTYDSLARTLLASDLDSRIAECRYHLLYHDGLILYGRRDFTGAGECFTGCMDLRAKWKLEQDTALDTLYARTYAWYLTGVIRDGESRIWRNDFANASGFADSVLTEISVRQIAGDSLVKKAVAEYRKKIGGRICSNKKETAEVYCIRAWRNLELHRYYRAGQLLDSAIVLLKDHPECGFDIKPAMDTLSRYAFPARFQQMQNTVETMLICQKYDSAVMVYITAEKFFRDKRIDRFGLSMSSLFDFSRASGNRFVDAAAVHYYIRSKDFHSAFLYLELLRLIGIPAKEVKEEMKTVASSLAENDFLKDPAKDPALSAREYSSGTGWFSKFEFYYIYRWNELRDKVTK